MAILTFLLGLILLACGLGGLAMSVNLIPTEMGMLYALSGVVFLSAAAVVCAIAALIARLDRIVAPAPKKDPPASPAVETVPAPAAETPAPPPEEDANFNRSGRLPDLSAIEAAIAEPEATPQVVGRYTAGGAKYMIFSDGAIEAETEQGAFRFASMAEFKTYIAGRKD